MTLQFIPPLVFGSVFLLVVGLQQALNRRSAELARHLDRFTGPPSPGARPAPGQGDLFRQRRTLSHFPTLDAFLTRRGFSASMDRDLARAAIPLRVGEYLLIRVGAGLVLSGVAGIITGAWLLALPAAAVGYMLPALYVWWCKRKRANLLDQQLIDALALMAGGLRAGYSFLQGAEAVVRELPPPICEEFTSLLQDLRVGVPMEDALIALGQRAPSEEIDMMVTAILVQRASGGNLASILDTIAYTIRERLRIRREVQTLTAQERMSSYVIGSLPIVAFVFLTITNPDYLNLLFGNDLGRLLLVGAGVLELFGFFIIRKIIDIRV